MRRFRTLDCDDYCLGRQTAVGRCCGHCSLITAYKNGEVVGWLLHKLDDNMKVISHTPSNHRCSCGNPVGSIYKINCTRSWFKTIFRCDTCNDYINKMFEFFQNPHPCMRGLSKIDYLDDASRRNAISQTVGRLTSAYYFYIFVLKSLKMPILPREIQMEIIFAMINNDYQRYKLHIGHFIN